MIAIDLFLRQPAHKDQKGFLREMRVIGSYIRESANDTTIDLYLSGDIALGQSSDTGVSYDGLMPRNVYVHVRTIPPARYVISISFEPPLRLPIVSTIFSSNRVEDAMVRDTRAIDELKPVLPEDEMGYLAG